MSAQLAEADLLEPQLVQEPVLRSDIHFDGDLLDDDKGSPARGIAIAMLLALPFWALIAVTIYMIM